MPLGDIGTVIETLVDWPNISWEPSVCHIYGDVYALAFRGPDSDGYIATFSIDAAGAISDEFLDYYEFDGTHCEQAYVIKAGDGYLCIAYKDNAGDPVLITIAVTNAGVITHSINDTLNIRYDGAGSMLHLLHITGNVYAVSFQDGGGYIVTHTFTITEGAIPISVTATYAFEQEYPKYPILAKVTANIYALFYFRADQYGRCKTFTISDTGVIGSLIDTMDFMTNVKDRMSVALILPNLFCVAISHYDTDNGFFKIVEINDSGAITDTVKDTLEFDTVKGTNPYVISLGRGYLCVVETGEDEHGEIKTYLFSYR